MSPLRILVLRLSSLGDVVLTSSFLRSLDDHFPGAAIDFVVRDDLAAVAAMLPGVRRVVAVPRTAGVPAVLALGRQLAREPYAHVFDQHHSLRSWLLSFGLRGRLRPGFDKQSVARWLLVHAHRNVYDRFGGARSLRERMLRPLLRMGLQPRLHPTQLCVSPVLRASAEATLQDAGVQPGEPLIGIAPGARWPSKRWPAERFAALVARLAQALEHRFVLLGSADEAALVAAVKGSVAARCVDLAGRLDLPQTAAVLARCHLVVSNDSGLMHIAEAVGRPALAFFGPTAPEFGYTPYRAASRYLYAAPPCSPCSKNGSRPCARPTHECMDGIGVDDAYAAARAIVEGASATETVT